MEASQRPLYYQLEHESDDVERLERYCAGGYHPVHLHDTLNDRYEVFHKLGFGAFSTIWLARDRDTDSNVALKILTADNDRPVESKILAALNTGVRECSEIRPLGRFFLPALIDQFDVDGPNGHHHCLVMTPSSCSLRDARDPSFSSSIFSLPVARVIIAQVAEALDVIHSQGVIHGDLHPGNIFLCLPDTLRGVTLEQFYEACDDVPERIAIRRSDGQALTANVPSYAVEKANLGKAAEDLELREASVLVGDFGEAFNPAETSRVESRTPLAFRAPEHIVPCEQSVSFASDIWSLGCLFFTLMGQQHLFKAFLPDEDKVLLQQVNVLGRLSESTFRAWENRAMFFDDDFKYLASTPAESLSDRINASVVRQRRNAGLQEPDHDELDAFQSLLRSMLAPEPGDRLSAAQVLQSEWMAKWGLPELRKAEVLWKSEEMQVDCAQPGPSHGNESRLDVGGNPSPPMEGEKRVALAEGDGRSLTTGAAPYEEDLEVISPPEGPGQGEEGSQERNTAQSPRMSFVTGDAEREKAPCAPPDYEQPTQNFSEAS